MVHKANGPYSGPRRADARQSNTVPTSQGRTPSRNVKGEPLAGSMPTPASHLTSSTPRIQAVPDSRFLVGIDLGTTNCAVAAVDTRARRPRVTLFRIPQLTEASVVAARALLPSFLYFAEPHEIANGVVAMPWNRTPDAIAGVLAR